MRRQICLDLDGTLTDPQEGFVRSVQHAMRAVGREPAAPPIIARLIGPPLRSAFAVLLETEDETLLTQAVLAYRTEYEAGGIFGTALYPGMSQCLGALAANGHRLVMVTAKPAPYARRVVEHLGLTASFAAIYGPELAETAYSKTDILGRALDGTQVLGCESVMVGDREEDIVAAKRHRIASIAVAWGYGSREELEAARPDHLVTSPQELQVLLSGD